MPPSPLPVRSCCGLCILALLCVVLPPSTAFLPRHVSSGASLLPLSASVVNRLARSGLVQHPDASLNKVCGTGGRQRRGDARIAMHGGGGGHASGKGGGVRRVVEALRGRLHILQETAKNTPSAKPLVQWHGALPRRKRARLASFIAASSMFLASSLGATQWRSTGSAFAPTPTASTEVENARGGMHQQSMPEDWQYSDFFLAVKKGKVDRVIFSADMRKLVSVDHKGTKRILQAIPADPELIPTLIRRKVDIVVVPQMKKGGGIRPTTVLTVLLIAAMILIRVPFDEGSGSQFGPGGPAMSMNRMAKFKVQAVGDVTFADVMGVDQAKLELEEVVQFLKEPDLFTNLGAIIPRGVMLYGPPGTGKTLLARAVAGEAGVPFLSISGSEFVEMFVGVGASRVRELFQQARANAPSIIFIDEIDAVGRERGTGIAGGNDEREQTLNQILTEMDGFEGNTGVIVIAATNREDVLDPALLRPGRFDRRVTVDLPDLDGRTAILGVHSRGKPLEPDVDLGQVARRCPGFSGAALANLMNEAAIFAARRNKTSVGCDEIGDALDRIMLGPEKKEGASAHVTNYKKELVAYHEAGHALVGSLLPDFDQVFKVSIVPRGRAGGLTFFAPPDSRSEGGMYTRQYLEAQMCVGLGGRVAEEIVYGEQEVTTGASNDFEQVTKIARAMVTRFGMSPLIGQVTVNTQSGGNPFMGRSMSVPRYGPSSATQRVVDAEVMRLVMAAYRKARGILEGNRGVLDTIARQLVERENVSAEELQVIIEQGGVKMGIYE